MANRMDDTTSLYRIIIHGNEGFTSSELLKKMLPQGETIHENFHFFPFSDLKPGKIFQLFEPNFYLKNQIEESEEGVEVSAILVLISQIEIFSEGMHSSILNLPYSQFYGFSEKDEKNWWNHVIVAFSFVGEEDITENDQIDQIKKSIDGNKGIKEIFKKAGSRYISVSNRTSLEEFIRRLQAQPITEKLVLGGSHSIGFQEMYSSCLKATNDGKKKAMLQDVHQRFILFGEKKSGKSALGNLLLGKLLFASDFQCDQSGKGKMFMIGHTDIEAKIANNNYEENQKLNTQIVDQPEGLKAKQYGEFLASCISNVSTTFLIVINLKSGPLSEEEFIRLKDFHQILKSSGFNFFPNAGIVFTHEDELEEEGSRASPEEILKHRLEHESSYSFTHKLISLVADRYIFINAVNMSNKNRNKILRKLFQFPYSNQCIKSNPPEKSFAKKNTHSDPVNNGNYGSGVINNTQGIHLIAGKETNTNINVARGEEGASTKPKEYKDCGRYQKIPGVLNLMSFWKRSGSVVDPNQDDVSCQSDPNFEDMIAFLQEELIPDPSMTGKRKMNNQFTLNNFEVDMTNALRILTEFSGKQLVIVVIYLDRDFNQKVYKEIMELLQNFKNYFQLFVFKVESDLAKNKVKNNPNLKMLAENCCIFVNEKRTQLKIQDSQPILNSTVVIQVYHNLVFGDPGPNSLLFSYFHLDKITQLFSFGSDGGMEKGDPASYVASGSASYIPRVQGAPERKALVSKLDIVPRQERPTGVNKCQYNRDLSKITVSNAKPVNKDEITSQRVKSMEKSPVMNESICKESCDIEAELIHILKEINTNRNTSSPVRVILIDLEEDFNQEVYNEILKLSGRGFREKTFIIFKFSEKKYLLRKKILSTEILQRLLVKVNHAYICVTKQISSKDFSEKLKQLILYEETDYSTEEKQPSKQLTEIRGTKQEIGAYTENIGKEEITDRFKKTHSFDTQVSEDPMLLVSSNLLFRSRKSKVPLFSNYVLDTVPRNDGQDRGPQYTTEVPHNRGIEESHVMILCSQPSLIDHL